MKVGLLARKMPLQKDKNKTKYKNSVKNIGNSTKENTVTIINITDFKFATTQ